MSNEKTQRRGTLPILTYHAIEDGDGPLSVSPRRFAEHLEAISSLGYATTALEKSVNRLYRWEDYSVDREIAITFDDGYASVLTEAMPLLERFGFKATVFVISDLVGCRLEGRELLGWRDISALSKAGVEIGSHTATHAMLTQLDLAGTYREVGDSKRRIEDHLGKAVRYFAYPRGLATARVRRVVVECGYAGACGTVAGTNTNRADPYFLRRRELYDHDDFQGAIAKLRGKGVMPASAYSMARSIKGKPLASVRQRTPSVSPADSSDGPARRAIRLIFLFFNELENVAYILLSR